MLFSLGYSKAAGFSYLLLFKKEYHSEISLILKQGPDVFDVVAFVTQNNHCCLIEEKIKPSIFNDLGQIEIEDVGNEPSPVKKVGTTNLKKRKRSIKRD